MKESAGATTTTTTMTESAARQQHGGASGLWARVTDHLPFLRTKRGLAVTVGAILVIVGGGLAGLAALRNRNGSQNGRSGGSATGGVGRNPNAITDDSYFYGQSPPVYPSREWSRPVTRFCFALHGQGGWVLESLANISSHTANITGTGSWASSLQRAQAMVANMTLDEKVRPGSVNTADFFLSHPVWSRSLG